MTYNPSELPTARSLTHQQGLCVLGLCGKDKNKDLKMRKIFLIWGNMPIAPKKIKSTGRHRIWTPGH